MCRQVCIFSSFALAAEDPVEEKSDRSSLFVLIMIISNLVLAFHYYHHYHRS